MENEFVSYEIALAIKELGFDEPCFSCYYIDGILMDSPNEDGSIYPGDNLFINHTNNYCEKGQSCSAPTFSQCFRWFREKGYDVKVQKESEGLYFGFYWTGAAWITVGAGSYEEAELACLKKLIEIIKSQKE